MAKNFQGVLSTPTLSASDLAELSEPRPYDMKLDVIRATLTGDFEAWYQNIVNLPATKWRAAIDAKIAELCDADNRKPVTLHALKEAARRCGCITCTGALAGIADAVKWYRVNRAAHVYARKNRQYFIQRLREAIASPTVNHN